MTVRDLDTATLQGAAQHYAREFLSPTILNAKGRPILGRGLVMKDMYDFHYKDEFNYVRSEMKQWLGAKALAEFDDEASKHFAPRSDDVLAQQLALRLAITPDGKSIPGKIGLVEKGSVIIGFRFKTHVWVRDAATGKKVKVNTGKMIPRPVRAHIHVGETIEEATLRTTKAIQDQGDMIFPMSHWPPTMALATRISNEAAIAACDAIVDRLDEGSTTGIIRILDGTQATDPDTAIGAQVTLALLVCSDPVFGAAADANPGGRATASAISDDASADATGTASWFRASASNDGSTSLDDHIDGSAGTATVDLVLNTASIVSGAAVGISSWTFTVPES